MKKLLLIFGALFVLGFAALVYAAIIIESVPVTSCIDSDNGLNFFTVGYVYGEMLDGTPYFLIDFCVHNDTIREYSCNTRQDPPHRQLWYENCTLLGSSGCLNGRCIPD